MPSVRTCHISIRLTLSFLLMCAMGEMRCFAQRADADVFSRNDILFSNMRVVSTDSGFTIAETVRQNCKGSYTEIINFPQAEVQSVLIPVPVAALPAKPKFLIIHGNISYDYFYRSKIDTPFNQQDLQQHTERVNLRILLKEKYPLNISFSSRQSNSPFFRNFLDANFQFDKYSYLKNIKKVLLDKVNKQIPEQPDLKNAEAQLKEEIQKLEKLKVQLEDPNTLQKIIEERERIYYEKIKAQKEKELTAAKQKNISLSIQDSIYAVKANDSLAGQLGKTYETKQATLVPGWLLDYYANKNDKYDFPTAIGTRDAKALQSDVPFAAGLNKITKVAYTVSGLYGVFRFALSKMAVGEITDATIAKALEGSTMKTTQSSVSLPAIKKYVEMLKNGSASPAIKVADGVIIDGNHRYIASRIMGLEAPQVPGAIAPSMRSSAYPIQNIKIDPLAWANH